MSDFGLFEGAVAEEYNTPLRIQAHRANVQNTLKEIVATFGGFLRNAKHRDDYLSRVALVQSDIDSVIVEHRLSGRDRAGIMRALADYAEREDPVDKDDSHNPGIQVPWGKEKVNSSSNSDKTEDARLEHVAAKKGVGRRTADWYGGDDSYDPVQGINEGDWVSTSTYVRDRFSGEEIPPGSVGHVVEIDGDDAMVEYDTKPGLNIATPIQDIQKEGMSKMAAWAWDPDSNSYKSSNNKFACSCGGQIEGVGQHHCRCGKVYNMSSIFNASKRANGAPMYACREVETSDKLVLAKKANNSGASNMGTRRQAAGTGLPTGTTPPPATPPTPPPVPATPPTPATPPAASAPPPPAPAAPPTNLAPSPSAPPVPSTPPAGGMNTSPAPTTAPLFNGGPMTPGGGSGSGAQSDPFADQGGFGFQSPSTPAAPAAPKRDPRGKGMVPDYSMPGAPAPSLLDKAKNWMGLQNPNSVSPMVPAAPGLNPFKPSDQAPGALAPKPLNMSDKLYNTLMGSGLEPSEFLKEHYDDLLTLYDGYENMHELMTHGGSVRRQAAGIADFPPPKKDSDDDSVKHLFADPGPAPEDNDLEGNFKKSTVATAKKLRANAAVWPLINDKDLQNNWKSLLGIITDPTQVHALEDGDYQQLVQDLYDELRFRGLGTPTGDQNSRLPDPMDPNGMMGGGGLGGAPTQGPPPAQHGQPPQHGGQPPAGQPPTPGQHAQQQMATPPGQPGQHADPKKSPSMLAYRKGFRLARKGWAPLDDEPIEVMAGWVIGLDANLRAKTAVEDPYANRSTVYDGSEPAIPGIPVSRDDLVDGSNIDDPTQAIREDFARDTDRRDEEGQSEDDAANHPEDFKPKGGLSTDVRHVDVLGRDSRKKG